MKSVTNIHFYHNIIKHTEDFAHSISILKQQADGSVGFKTSLDLDFSLSWSWSWVPYKVYGTFIFVPGLELGTSGLKPNTGWWKKITLELSLFSFQLTHSSG